MREREDRELREVLDGQQVAIDTVLQNEENAVSRAIEHNNKLKLTLTLRQIILVIIVLSTIGRATSGRWWFDYKQASQVRRLSDENNRLDNEVNMLRQKEVKSDEHIQWLWHSHNTLNALLDDDDKPLSMVNSHDGLTCWEWFRDRGSSTRNEAFIGICNDGNHPKLKKWVSKKTSQN